MISLFHKVIKVSVFLCLFLFLSLPLIFPKTIQSRIAVITFNAINLSKAEAEIFTGLFETALVKTETFNVIEQNRINEILAAQEFSLSDCTDTACAVEIGKLLSAEQIVLGTISQVEKQFILNAKIIDVKTGKNIKADNVSADSLTRLTDKIELLAFKLAGLTYTKGEEVIIAKQFGDIFVETKPAGAEVYINGIKRGISPDLFSHVPLGQIIIEARVGNLYGKKVLELLDTTNRISMTLATASGNLFIKSSVREVNVILDGKDMGELGPGYFENIPIGIYTLALRGKFIYWKDEIEIIPNENLKIEANPREYGFITYDIPNGIKAKIEGNQFEKSITGSGTLDYIWTGSYIATANGKNCEELKVTIEVKKGETTGFRPVMSYTIEYETDLFTARLNDAEGKLVGENRITDADINVFTQLVNEIQSSKHDLKTLLTKAESIKEKATQKKAKQDERETLVNLKKTLEVKIKNADTVRQFNTILGWTTLGTGVACIAASIACWLLSDTAYTSYLGSTVTEDIIKYRKDFQSYDSLFYTSLTGAGVCLSGSFLLFLFTKPADQKDKNELITIDERIQVLEGESQ